MASCIRTPSGKNRKAVLYEFVNQLALQGVVLVIARGAAEWVVCSDVGGRLAPMIPVQTFELLAGVVDSKRERWFGIDKIVGVTIREH